MRMIVLSALFALGVGLAAPTTASATVLGSGLSNTSASATLIEKAAYSCRRVRVCRRGAYGRVPCHWNRVCRRW